MCPKLHIHLIVKTDAPQAWLKILLRVNSMILYYFILLFMEAVSELAFLTSFILMMTCFTISWGLGILLLVTNRISSHVVF